MLPAKKRVTKVTSAAKRKPKGLDSLRKLAKALGKSHVALGKLAKREDWPFKPPYNAAEVKAWCEINATGPAGETQLTPQKDLKLKLMAAQLAKLELEYQTETKALVSREQVERERVQRVMAVKAELLNTPRLMAMLASATTPQEQEATIRQWLKEICDRFAGES